MLRSASERRARGPKSNTLPALGLSSSLYAEFQRSAPARRRVKKRKATPTSAPKSNSDSKFGTLSLSLPSRVQTKQAISKKNRNRRKAKHDVTAGDIYGDVSLNGPREVWQRRKKRRGVIDQSNQSKGMLYDRASRDKTRQRGAALDTARSESRCMGSSLQKLPRPMRVQTMWLRDEFSYAAKGEQELRKRNTVLIDDLTKGLPLDFMFKVRSREFVEERGLMVITKILNKLISNKMFAAWKIWHKFVRTCRVKELKRKAKGRKNQKGIQMLLKAGKNYERGVLERGFMKWSKQIARMRRKQRSRAVKVIQRNARVYLARRQVAKFKAMGAAAKFQQASLALRAVLFERVTRRRQRSRIASMERDFEREEQYAAMQRAALRLQTRYRGRLGLLRAEYNRKLMSAALRVQCSWRCRKGRLVLHLLEKGRAEQLAAKQISATHIQRTVRGHHGRIKFKKTWARREAYRRRLDEIQRWWWLTVKRMMKKHNHESAMAQGDVERRERWLEMLAAQKHAATMLQAFARQTAARVFVDRRRRDWTAAANVLQRRWRKTMEQRVLQADYQQRRDELRGEAIVAQNALIPWLNLYPELVLKLVGKILQKDPATVGFFEVSQLRRALTDVREHHRRMLASLVLQRIYRGFLGKLIVATICMRAIEARKRAEHFGCTEVQRSYRAHQGRRWALIKRTQQQCARLLRRVPLLADLGKLCTVLQLPQPGGRFDGFTVNAALRAAYTSLWYEDVELLVQSMAWGQQWRQETGCARLLQRVYRGHSGRVHYLKTLAAQMAAIVFARRSVGATKIAALLRGVYVRRTDAARIAIAGVLGLDHYNYPHIKTPALKTLLRRPPERYMFTQIAMMDRVTMEWTLYAQMEASARMVQRRFRGLRGRFAYNLKLRAKKQLDADSELAAATLLQQIWRGRQAKKSFRLTVLRLRNARLREQYMMEKRAQAQQREWEVQLKTSEKRSKLMLQHKQRLREQDLRAEIDWSKLKATYAEEMLECAKVEQTHTQDLRTLNAWRQFAEHDGRVYYYNEVTGESTYDAPAHWKFPNHQPKKLLYWKNFDDVKAAATQTLTNEEQAICRHCNTRAATRECNECVSRFCLPCFTNLHQSADMITHTYNAVDTVGARSLKCIECETEAATRKCEQCDDVYCRRCYKKVHSRGQRANHKYIEFKPGSLICVECDADFATVDCEACGDVFCAMCSAKMHAKGAMAKHELQRLEVYVKEILGEDEEYCAECEARIAERVCDQCSDPFCVVCYKNLHSKGLRQKHTWKPYDETGLASGWQEYWDEDTKKYTYFNARTKETRTTKPIELMALGERMDIERMQREEMQKAKMEADLRKMQSKLEDSEKKKEEAEVISNKLVAEKEKREKIRSAVKKGYKKLKTKFMFGKRRHEAESYQEEEFLKQTVLDTNYTADVYKGEILKDLSADRSKLRHETFLKAQKDKERMKREEIATKLNDEDEAGIGGDDFVS